MSDDRRPAPDPAPPIMLNAWKCWRCGRTLARLSLLPGCAVEIKCGSCGAMNTAALGEKRSA